MPSGRGPRSGEKTGHARRENHDQHRDRGRRAHRQTGEAENLFDVYGYRDDDQTGQRRGGSCAGNEEIRPVLG